MHIHDAEALKRILVGGDVGAGEAYMDGLWSSPDLVALISLAVANRHALALSRGWWRTPAKIARSVGHRRNRNTSAGSKRNITAHYDLGNEFYELWLDETMTYSSAVFETPAQSLADAQRNKDRAIASDARIQPGDAVLEIGTGWGGFALHAAAQLGCHVTTVTISQAQHDRARKRVKEAELEDLVTVELRDYRDISGTYDAVVSIEMLEAVGAEYYRDYFGAVSRALKPGGKASIQVITFPHDAYEAQLRGANWIQRYIFPGGVLPSLTAIESSLDDTGLLVTGVRDIRDSYALTLKTWRTSFFEHIEEVRALGFDDRFIRMWEYYLAYCEGGFADRYLGNVQMILTRPGCRRDPILPDLTSPVAVDEGAAR